MTLAALRKEHMSAGGHPHDLRGLTFRQVMEWRLARRRESLSAWQRVAYVMYATFAATDGEGAPLPQAILPWAFPQAPLVKTSAGLTDEEQRLLLEAHQARLSRERAKASADVKSAANGMRTHAD